MLSSFICFRQAQIVENVCVPAAVYVYLQQVLPCSGPSTDGAHTACV